MAALKSHRPAGKLLLLEAQYILHYDKHIELIQEDTIPSGFTCLRSSHKILVATCTNSTFFGTCSCKFRTDVFVFSID